MMRKTKVWSKNKNPRWNNGKSHMKSGYVEINRNINKRIFEHRFVMEKHIKRPLKKGECVHHIDGNRANNTLKNLHLCSSIGEHNRLHAVKPHLLKI
jgi:hypothetical protein